MPQDKRERHLKDAFGITPAEWDKVLAHQGGVCFVCGRESIGKRLSTDHSHDDGLFRALLCHSCNALLGKVENNFKRYGLGKVLGLTVIKVLLRFAELLARPPAVEALGRRVFGYPGKVGTKAYRAWVKRNRVSVPAPSRERKR